MMDESLLSFIYVSLASLPLAICVIDFKLSVLVSDSFISTLKLELFFLFLALSAATLTLSSSPNLSPTIGTSTKSVSTASVLPRQPSEVNNAS